MTALRALAPGLLPVAVVGLVVGAAAAGLLLAGARVDLGGALASRYVRAVIAFTLLQATLSALLAVVLAIPVARALTRRRAFPGRMLLLRVLGLPMVMPTIVAVMGLVAIYGRSGYLNELLGWLGAGRIDLYGLGGILLAHTFLNLPFCTRVLVQALGGVPGESWRLAAQLGMTGGQIFRLIEWPAIRAVVPSVAALVFMLCFTSFAVVLILGGGPPNATLEVAIFQAIRVEFDLGRALSLSIVQVALCLVAVLLFAMIARPVAVLPHLGRPIDRPDTADPVARVIDAVAIAFVVLLVGLPLATLVATAAFGPWGRVLGGWAFWDALLRSLAIGLSAGTLALALGLGLTLAARGARQRLGRPALAGAFDLVGTLTLIAPPMVLGAGLFVLLRGATDVFALGPVLVAGINALMGIAFVTRVLQAPALAAGARWQRLADGLGMRGWHRFRLVDWPTLRRPAGLALALASTLAMGDFGVIALFGTAHTQTLPYLLHQLMGAYRMDEAAIVAVLLLGLTLALFLGLERLVGGPDRTEAAGNGSGRGAVDG